MNFHILGAGIAGLTAAAAVSRFTRNTHSEVHIWEKENLPCMHSSSRNAAIFRTYEADPSLSILVKDSYRHLLELEKTTGAMMDRRGLLIDPVELDYYEESYCANYPALSGLRGHSYVINLDDKNNFRGILLEQNGVMDIHAYQNFLIKNIKASGVIFHYNACIQKLNTKNGYIASFQEQQGKVVQVGLDSMIINAGGAWARDIVSQSGLWTPPVYPYKRHLFFIRHDVKQTTDNLSETSMAPDFKMPVLWNEKRDVYIRAEGDGFLATHCDQREVLAGDYAADEKEVHRFMESIVSVFPFLENYHISRYWACLRTFALDQMPVIGLDPFIKNLFWVCGLGGRGITLSPGLIPMIQTLIYEYMKHDGDNSTNNAFSPDRFC